MEPGCVTSCQREPHVWVRFCIFLFFSDSGPVEPSPCCRWLSSGEPTSSELYWWEGVTDGLKLMDNMTSMDLTEDGWNQSLTRCCDSQCICSNKHANIKPLHGKAQLRPQSFHPLGLNRQQKPDVQQQQLSFSMLRVKYSHQKARNTKNKCPGNINRQKQKAENVKISKKNRGDKKHCWKHTETTGSSLVWQEADIKSEWRRDKETTNNIKTHKLKVQVNTSGFPGRCCWPCPQYHLWVGQQHPQDPYRCP